MNWGGDKANHALAIAARSASDDTAGAITIGKAKIRDASSALLALDIQSVDVRLSTANAVGAHCKPNNFIWLWSEEGAKSGFSFCFESKGVVALLFRQSQFKKAHYALSAIALGTPAKAGAQLAYIDRAQVMSCMPEW